MSSYASVNVNVTSKLGDSNAKTAGGDFAATNKITYTVNCGFKPSSVSIVYKPEGYDIITCTYNSNQNATQYYFTNHSTSEIKKYTLGKTGGLVTLNITDTGFTFYRGSGNNTTIHWIAKE